MNFQPCALLIALPPLPGVLVLGWMLKIERGKRRYPFGDPVLRPPGESCRDKIGDLQDKALLKIFLFIAPIIVALCAYYAKASVNACLVLAILSVLSTAFLLFQLRAIALEVDNYQLGFEGERHVGQFLNEGLALGWRIFHDVPFEGFNIDHVVVAPSGVYAIETKTRRKAHGAGAHQVVFDGEQLIATGWTNDSGVRQAELNAKTLSQWLAQSVGAQLWVEPILTLPGWYVIREKKGRVNVYNPKEIVHFIDSKNDQKPLSQELIQSISYQLGQKDKID